MTKIAIIHGTWIPDVDNETGWELAVTPIIQTYCNSNCTRYIPEGRFSLVNLTDETYLDKALSESMKFHMEIDKFIKVTNVPGQPVMTPCPTISRLNLHNLGSIDDDGEEYDVYLMLPTNLVTTLKDQCFAWDGMMLLRDIEVEKDEELEMAVLGLLRQVRFGG